MFRACQIEFLQSFYYGSHFLDSVDSVSSGRIELSMLSYPRVVISNQIVPESATMMSPNS